MIDFRWARYRCARGDRRGDGRESVRVCRQPGTERGRREHEKETVDEADGKRAVHGHTRAHTCTRVHTQRDACGQRRCTATLTRTQRRKPTDAQGGRDPGGGWKSVGGR